MKLARRLSKLAVVLVACMWCGAALAEDKARKGSFGVS